MYNNILEFHLHKALKNYFQNLGNTGYVGKSTVDSLVVLVGIDYFLNSPINLYITEQDYKTFQNIVSCILGKDCMLPPLRTGKMFLGQAYTPSDEALRITEDDIYRISEDGEIRVVE